MSTLRLSSKAKNKKPENRGGGASDGDEEGSQDGRNDKTEGKGKGDNDNQDGSEGEYTSGPRTLVSVPPEQPMPSRESLLRVGDVSVLINSAPSP